MYTHKVDVSISERICRHILSVLEDNPVSDHKTHGTSQLMGMRNPGVISLHITTVLRREKRKEITFYGYVKRRGWRTQIDIKVCFFYFHKPIIGIIKWNTYLVSHQTIRQKPLHHYFVKL